MNFLLKMELIWVVFDFFFIFQQLVMSSAFETLLEAARFIELQEQRERLTSTSSTASSLSTSPHSNSRYHYPTNYASHQVTTPPASPLSDVPRSHIDFINSNGTTITRNGKSRRLSYSINNGRQLLRFTNDWQAETKNPINHMIYVYIAYLTKCFAMCGLIGASVRLTPIFISHRVDDSMSPCLHLVWFRCYFYVKSMQIDSLRKQSLYRYIHDPK